MMCYLSMIITIIIIIIIPVILWRMLAILAITSFRKVQIPFQGPCSGARFNEAQNAVVQEMIAKLHAEQVFVASVMYSQ